jgi:ribosomal protein S18 acetylase RimI-like enzyme
MASIRPFEAVDLLKFNLTNLDQLTENYDITFYLTYLARWPSLFNAVEGPHGEIHGYSRVIPLPSSFLYLIGCALPTCRYIFYYLNFYCSILMVFICLFLSFPAIGKFYYFF